jgi:glyoxylase-like metal-dependent hydrolase (beta-lactamase superfamily II)
LAATSSTDALEVIQVKYGERITQKSAVFHDYAGYGQPDGDLHMEYNYWILRRGDQLILFDTGYDISARDWLGEISVLPTPESLKLLGVDPLAVSMVITSHFHYDHIGYLGLFENAQVVSGAREHEYWFGKLHYDHIGYLSLFANAQVVSAQAEYDYWFAKWASDSLDGEFTIAEHLEAVRAAEQEGRLLLVDKQADVWPGVTVYPVGGHCPGELVTLARSRSGPIILAADAAHFYEQLENEWPFFAFTDLGEMRRALAFIKQLASSAGAVVVPGHDGRVRDRFPALDGTAASIATVLG